MLTKKDILALNDRKVEDLIVPEWDTTVKVAEFGADAKDELDQYLAAQNISNKDEDIKRVHIRGAVAAVSLVDDNNNQIFTISDAEELGKKNGVALDRIFEVSNRLNKIFGVERDKVKKKSKTTPSD